MSVINKIETLGNRAQNTSLKKDISLISRHIKLLYKYGTRLEDDFSDSMFWPNNPTVSELNIILNLVCSILRPYKYILEREYSQLFSYGPVAGHNIELFLEHTLDLLDIQLTGENEIEEGNIFLGIEEKMKRANKSANEGNAEGLFSNLHTAIEVLLKDKLGISLNMDAARLGKVLGICIRHDVFKGKANILRQLDAKMCEIDNKMQHTAYNPSPREINDALLITTQAIRILKTEIACIESSAKDEISAILIKNN